MAGDASPDGTGRKMLRYFGLETGEKAGQTLLWTSPYLAILTLAMGLLSYLVQRLFPMALWVHLVAIVLALVYFFFFLARMRQLSAQAEGAGEGPEEGPDP